MNRWENLRNSDHELQRLASSSSTTLLPIGDFVPKAVGRLIRQQPIPETGQFVCLHENPESTAAPLQLICDLGCCESGCCAVEEMAEAAPNYGWAVGMLVLFLILVGLAVVVATILFCTKRSKYSSSSSSNSSTVTSRLSSIPNTSLGGGPVYYSTGNLFPKRPH